MAIAAAALLALLGLAQQHSPVAALPNGLGRLPYARARTGLRCSLRAGRSTTG